jgi:protease PrsW
MQVLGNSAFLIIYALLQTIVFLLAIRFLDLYEREPMAAIFVLATWGATGAVALSLAGNAAVLGALPPGVRTVFGPAIAAPLIEEISKGVALVAAFGVSYGLARRFGTLEFEGVTDGVVYGAAVGLGFAFTEDILYLLNAAQATDIDAGMREYLDRVDFFGIGQLAHAVYTGVFGAGLGLATWSRTRVGRLGFPTLGLVAAMLMHAVHNGLPSLLLVLRYGFEDTLASARGFGLRAELYERMVSFSEGALTVSRVADYVFVGLFVLVMVLWLRHQRRVIEAELGEERDDGLLTTVELDVISHPWRRSSHYLMLISAGRLEARRVARRMHDELVDLAFLKRRARSGGVDPRRLESRRERIRALREYRIVEEI